MMRSLTEPLRPTLDAWRDRRARDRALRTALARFGALHAHWAASCFDATFVRRIGVDAVLAGPSVEVARSWTLQFRYADERTRERDVRQLEPVVESFAVLLRDALAEVPPPPSRRRVARPNPRPCADGVLVCERCA